MRESRSYGSEGERGGNEPLYPELLDCRLLDCRNMRDHIKLWAFEIADEKSTT